MYEYLCIQICATLPHTYYATNFVVYTIVCSVYGVNVVFTSHKTYKLNWAQTFSVFFSGSFSTWRASVYSRNISLFSPFNSCQSHAVYHRARIFAIVGINFNWAMLSKSVFAMKIHIHMVNRSISCAALARTHTHTHTNEILHASASLSNIRLQNKIFI